MQITTLSSQGQTTVPAIIREELKLKPGQPIKWQIAKDNSGVIFIMMRPLSKKIIKSLRGIAKNHYQKIGGGKAYLEKERVAWV